jgi:hypothetical protein
MIRTRIAALLFALAFFGTLTVGAAKAEDIRVINTTATPVWVTLYADVGALGWTKSRFAKPGDSIKGSPWVYTRGSKESNGPWKLRFEVNSPNGKHYDLFTTMWYDGAQHRFTSGPDSNLFVCEKDGVYHWSLRSNCSGQDNSPGI